MQSGSTTRRPVFSSTDSSRGRMATSRSKTSFNSSRSPTSVLPQLPPRDFKSHGAARTARLRALSVSTRVFPDGPRARRRGLNPTRRENAPASLSYGVHPALLRERISDLTSAQTRSTNAARSSHVVPYTRHRHPQPKPDVHHATSQDPLPVLHAQLRRRRPNDSVAQRDSTNDAQQVHHG